MTELVAVKCSMCQVRDMVPAQGADGPLTFMVCPNCDDGQGQRINNSYDGVGPTRGRGSPV